jgi:hypothetical protein
MSVVQYLDWEAATPVAASWISESFADAEFPVRCETQWPALRQPMSVNVVGNLDGFLVNCWDDHAVEQFGAEFIHLMPVGPRAMGQLVEATSIDEPGLRRRIEDAVRESLTALAAHRDGTLCRNPHPSNATYPDWFCRRPAGHTTLDGWRAEHAMTAGHRWITGGELLS